MKDIESYQEDGKEIRGQVEEKGRWDLYKCWEKEYEKRGKTKTTDMEVDGGDTVVPSSHEDENEVRVSPVGVIDRLLEARAEMEILVDVVNVVEQQQFLGLTHVPRSRRGEGEQQGLELQRVARRAQIHRVCDRIQQGVDALRKREEKMVSFFEEMKLLRKRWRLKEYEGIQTEEGVECFVVDMSLPVEEEEGVTGLGQGEFVVSSTKEGHSVTLLRDGWSGGEGDVVVQGVEAIDAMLCRLRRVRMWQYICWRLETDFILFGGSGHGRTHEYVLKLARMALDRVKLDARHHNHHHQRQEQQDGRQQPQEDQQLQQDSDIIDTCNGGLPLGTHLEPPTTIQSHARLRNEEFVRSFIQSRMCCTVFEERAIRALLDRLAWSRVPHLVSRTTPSSLRPLLEELEYWIRYASVFYAISHMLADEREICDLEWRKMLQTRLLEHCCNKATYDIVFWARNDHSGEEQGLIRKQHDRYSHSIGRLVYTFEADFTWHPTADVAKKFEGQVLGNLQVEELVEVARSLHATLV